MSSELKKRKVPNVDPKGLLTDMSIEENNNDTQDMLQSMKTVLEQNQLQMAKMQSEIDGMKERISHVDKLENKCTHLEDKCTSLEKSVEVLIKHWKNSNSPPVPKRSYWIDKGYDNDYIQDVNNFFLSIDRNISNLHKGEDTNIEMGWEDDGNILLYDNVFDAHWEKLMDAVKLCNHRENISLFVGSIELTPYLLEILSKGLEVTKLTSLWLRNNLLPHMREVLEGVIGIVNTQPSMADFIWDNQVIGNTDDASFLLESIKQHPSINTVRFENSFGEDVNIYDMLCLLISGDKQFISIDLDNNDITTLGGTHLPDHIALNSRLQRLRLDGNGLNDNDATLIARALRNNSNLRVLHLQKNDGITDIGFGALERAVFDPTSLNSVAECNHTCSIVMRAHFDEFQNNVFSSDANSRYNKGKKIYHMFSLRHKIGTNVKLLDAELGDDSLILVPHVLERLHICSEQFLAVHPRTVDVRPLSVFFELVKGWHMPDLHETRKRGSARG